VITPGGAQKEIARIKEEISSVMFIGLNKIPTASCRPVEEQPTVG
jgi:hypothetical protein